MMLKYIGKSEKKFLVNGEEMTFQPNETIEVSRDKALKLLRVPFAGNFWEIIN